MQTKKHYYFTRKNTKGMIKALIIYCFNRVNFKINFNSNLIRKLLFLIAISIFTSSFLPACSKKNADDTNIAEINRIKTMLEGKWVFVNYTMNHHYSDKDNVNITSASPGDYISFAMDGKLVLRLLNVDDNSNYSVLPNNKILLYGADAFDIKTLSATQLILYRKDVVATENYYEETYAFQK